MKKITPFIFMSIVLLSCASNKTVKVDVFKTNDIALIEQFIAENPKSKDIPFLKQRVELLKKAANPKPVVEQVKEVKKSNVELEAAEFQQLTNELKEKHSHQTVGLLNQIFDNDPQNNKAIVIVKNNSDCNMILRIKGENGFSDRIPITSKAEITFVLTQGNYIFNSIICDANYTSEKVISKNTLISFDNPVITRQ